MNLLNCTYREKSYFSNPNVELKSKCLSFFHLNINSLSKIFDNFNHLFNELKLEFDILGISESRILKSQSLNINDSLQNYVSELRQGIYILTRDNLTKLVVTLLFTSQRLFTS